MANSGACDIHGVLQPQSLALGWGGEQGLRLGTRALLNKLPTPAVSPGTIVACSCCNAVWCVPGVTNAVVLNDDSTIICYTSTSLVPQDAENITVNRYLKQMIFCCCYGKQNVVRFVHS